MSPNDTIEERLRNTLTDVAESTRLSPDAWARVEQRARRRRVPRRALALAATLGVALAATLAVVLVARDDDGPRVTTADDLTTRCGAAVPADIEVTLSPDATAAQRDAVEQTLAGSNAVANFDFQSQEDGARILQCVYADQPDTLAGSDLTRIPAMFHVTLAAGADPGSLIRQLENDNVGAAPGRCSTPADLEVYMTVQAAPAAISSVRTAVEQSPGVANVAVVSKEDAYREFACRLVARPDLVEGLAPDALPVSFRITLEPNADFTTLIGQFRRLPDVEEVTDMRFRVALPIPNFESDDFGPAPLTSFTEIASGTDAVDGSAWQLSLRTGENGAYSALAEFPDGEVILEGVDDARGWESRGTGVNGITVGSARPDVTQVRVEAEGVSPFEIDTVSTPELDARLFVTRLPVGQDVTLIALDEAGNELYRIETQTRAPTTGP
jgi:cell division protein FtsX